MSISMLSDVVWDLCFLAFGILVTGGIIAAGILGVLAVIETIRGEKNEQIH